MALITKIRERMGIFLVIAVGFSLLAFVLGDILTSNTSLIFDNQNAMGTIAGENVSPQEFEAKFQQNLDNYRQQYQQDNVDAATTDNLRDQTWNQFINEKIFDKAYAELGLSVSTDELWDMVQGKFVHPRILEVEGFKDSLTGQFRPAEVHRYLENIQADEAQMNQWLMFEASVKKERIAQKYTEMIKGGMYVTKAEAEQDETDKSRVAQVSYLMLNYQSIPDTAVQISDSDLKSYYSKNEKKYEREASVKLEYIVWDVAPSASDNDEAKMAALNARTEFSKTESDSEFVMRYSDIKEYNPAFLPQGALPAEIEAIALASAPGTVLDPYLENNAYSVLKIQDVKEVPDSVKARHILIRIPQDGDSLKAKAKADSIMNVVSKNRGKFEELATSLSEDPGSAVKGGDLGWFKEGMMVKEFNDVCFNGKKGDLSQVTTQFGHHIIEITDVSQKSRRVKAAKVTKKIEVSTATDRQVYAGASNFVAKYSGEEEFDKGVNEMKLIKRVAENIKESDRSIAGLEQPREMIRWAYKAKEGEVSKVFQFGEKYVVAKLAEKNEEGIAPLEKVKTEVEAEVRKKKKAEQLIASAESAMSGAKQLNDVASKLRVSVQVDDNMTFANTVSPNLGSEFEVIGSVFALKKGEISKPVEGRTGVFVLLVNSFREPAPVTDLKPAQIQLRTSMEQRVDYQVFNALKDIADVTDNRAKYY